MSHPVLWAGTAAWLEHRQGSALPFPSAEDLSSHQGNTPAGVVTAQGEQPHVCSGGGQTHWETLEKWAHLGCFSFLQDRRFLHPCVTYQLMRV